MQKQHLAIPLLAFLILMLISTISMPFIFAGEKQQDPRNLRWIVEPVLDYDDMNAFSDGISIVQIDDLYGAVDSKGQERVPVMYDRMFPYENGVLRTGSTDQLIKTTKLFNRLQMK